MNKDSRVLVTGGFGFIGSSLIKALNDRGLENIVVCDFFHREYAIKNLRGLKYSRIVSPHNFNGLNSYHDVVFHLGANSSTSASMGDVMEQNYQYSENLFQKLGYADFGLRWGNNFGKFIFASSASVYGDSEKYEENPKNAYAFSKLAFEKYLLNYISGLESDKVKIARLFNVYGGKRELHKGDMMSFPTRMISNLLEAQPTTVYESDCVRDFVYIEDVAEMLIAMAEDDSDQVIYDLGSCEHHTFMDLVNEFLKYSDLSYKQAQIEIKPFSEFPGDKKKYQYYSLARNHFPNIERTKIADGVGRVYRELMGEYKR